MSFLKKYKTPIIINLFVALTYFAVLIIPNMFGIDDYYANTYQYQPEMTASDTVSHIVYHAINWNARIGETYYYIIGALPQWVHYLSTCIRYVILLNLIYLLIYGKHAKDNIKNRKYILTITTAHLLILSIFPAFGEVMIWSPGNYNYIFGMNILLLFMLNFRLMIDDVFILKKHPALKYVYYPLAFISGFTLEHVAPCIILYAAIIIYFKQFRKRKSIKQFIIDSRDSIVQIILMSIGLISMFFLSLQRIALSTDSLKIIDKQATAIGTTIGCTPMLLALIIVVAFYAIGRNHNSIKPINNLKWLLLHIPLSLLSLFTVYFAPTYFTARVTIYFCISLLAVTLAIFCHFFKTKKIIALTIIAESILIIICTLALRAFYRDFNDYNIIQKDIIIRQYSNGERNLICPLYPDKSLLHYNIRLYSYQYAFCDPKYIQTIMNDDTITITSYGF